MRTEEPYMIHFVLGEKVIKRLSTLVPRVGDEIRLQEKKFYRVWSVVWVFDEENKNRVNVGIAEGDTSNDD